MLDLNMKIMEFKYGSGLGINRQNFYTNILYLSN